LVVRLGRHQFRFLDFSNARQHAQADLRFAGTDEVAIQARKEIAPLQSCDLGWAWLVDFYRLVVGREPQRGEASHTSVF
jgi:hypothetical protein